MPRPHLRSLSVVALLGAACFQAPIEFTDEDGDGFDPNLGDCNDFVSDVNPNQDEICGDGVDNNCDGQIDEGPDADGDGFVSCDGIPDCNDADPNINPAAQDIQDGIDNDCNGNIDDAFIDNDLDGASEAEGDCNDADVLVGVNAIEAPGNNVDDDCNGQIDEALQPCDGGLSGQNPLNFARAIGLCDDRFLVNAEFLGANVNSARAIINDFGDNSNADTLNRPSEGAQMIHLSTGGANEAAHDRGTPFDGAFQGGDNVGDCAAFTHPDRQAAAPANGCGEADPAQVCDLIQMRLTLRVPQNAQSFSYQFQFFTSEYRTFRCTEFDDTFLALLDSTPFSGNISFDNQGNVVSVNNGFLDICIDDNTAGRPPNLCNANFDENALLAGTGYVVNGGGPNSDSAGATARLKTIAPAEPGDLITLVFSLHDEGDDILDSGVLIDNFLWELNPAEDPVTEVP
jgi:Putative metal-binding motif